MFFAERHNQIMTFKRAWLSIFSLCTLLMVNAAAAPYKWADLQVLSSEDNFQEYLDHALDVEPSKRNAAWTTVTERMGLNYLKSLLQKNKLPEGTDQRIEKISQWPIFRSNEFFIQARDKYFIKKLKLCIEINVAICEQQALKILSNFEHEVIFPVEFLKATKSIILSHSKRLSIARPLLEDKFSEFYCSKAPLKELVLTQITKHQEMGFTIHKDCLIKLQEEIEQIALEGNSFAQKILSTNKLLTPSFSQLLNIVTFLNHKSLPVEKVSMTIATLEKLSKSSDSRIVLIEKIKKIDPLPGRVFSVRDKVSIGKLKLIERNFPEMIDLYAKTCLAYLKGTKIFKYGNPTPECHSFFSMTEHLQTLPSSYLNDYRVATDFMKKD